MDGRISYLPFMNGKKSARACWLELPNPLACVLKIFEQPYDFGFMFSEE